MLTACTRSVLNVAWSVAPPRGGELLCELVLPPAVCHIVGPGKARGVCRDRATRRQDEELSREQTWYHGSNVSSTLFIRTKEINHH